MPMGGTCRLPYPATKHRYGLASLSVASQTFRYGNKLLSRAANFSVAHQPFRSGSKLFCQAANRSVRQQTFRLGGNFSGQAADFSVAHQTFRLPPRLFCNGFSIGGCLDVSTCRTERQHMSYRTSAHVVLNVSTCRTEYLCCVENLKHFVGTELRYQLPGTAFSFFLHHF